MAKKTTETVEVQGNGFPKIYIGPTIPKGYFKQNMVFADGLPVPAKELVEKYPVLGELIVPTSEYIQALEKLGTQGTRLNSYGLKAVEIMKEIANG